jgi:hypothetical protein
MSGAVHSNHPIVGTWRLTSFTERNIETGATSYPFGEAARAFVIYAENGYVATIFTTADRKPPPSGRPSDQEAIDLYRSVIAFAGRYELIDNRLIYRPEISWNEAWNGTTQERIFEVRGDRLEVTSVPTVSTLTGATTVFTLTWERAK